MGKRSSGRGGRGARLLASALLSLVAVAGCSSAEDQAAGYLAKAQQYYDAGDYAKAQLEARNAVQVDPKNPKARYLMALLADKAERVNDLVGNLMIAVDEDPNFIDARVMLGNVMFMGRAYDQAAEQAKALRELAPDDVRGLWLESRIKWQAGDRAAARALIDDAVRRKPDEAEGILIKASFLGTDDKAAGLAVLDEAIPRLPADKSAILRSLRANVLEEQGEFARAETDWQALAKLEPDNLEYTSRLAGAYTRQGKIDEAEKLLRATVDRAGKDGKFDAQLVLIRYLNERRGADAAEKVLKEFIAGSENSLPLQVELARQYESGGKPDEARKIYQQIADKDPKSAEGLSARTRLAAFKLTAGDTKAALALLDAVLTDMPDNGDALILRANIRGQAKQFDQAIADLRIALRRQPDAPQALLLLARIYDASGKPDLAGDTYRDLVDAYPAERQAILELSAHYIRQGQAADAEAVLRKRSEQLANDPDIQNRLVDALIAGGKFAEAEKEARRLSELAPTLGVGEYQLGRTLVGQQDFAGAIAAFRSALDKVPDSVPALRGLAEAQMRSGRASDATATVAAFVARNPEATGAELLLAELYTAAGNTDLAAKGYEKVIARRPDEIAAYVGLGRLAGTNVDQRLAVLRRAVAANPANADIALLLGVELQAAGRHDEAIQLYEAALAKTPNSPPLINNLAVLLVDQRKDEASLKRALALMTPLQGMSDPYLLDTLGWVNYRNKDYPRAVSFLERAVTTAGPSPIPHYHLGMAYAAAENPVGARTQLEKALRKGGQQPFPEMAEAKATLARLK